MEVFCSNGLKDFGGDVNGGHREVVCLANNEWDMPVPAITCQQGEQTVNQTTVKTMVKPVKTLM